MSLDLTSTFSQHNINAPNSNCEEVYEFEDFRLDAAHLMLYRNGETISLKPKVIETLVALVERRGELISKDELMSRLWADSFVEESNLTQNIYLLRQTLGEMQNGQPFIETFRRRGYRFNGEIKTETTQTIEEKDLNEVHTFKAEVTDTQAQIAPQNSSAKIRMLFFAAGAIFLIAAISISYRFLASRPAASTAPIESVAVMPFVNESGNAEVEYLSDGMTETLINHLSQIPKLYVKARSSVFRYKGKENETRKIGKELNVQAVLSGRVVQRGDELTLYLSLVDAKTENQIWGKQYNRNLINLVALQTEIARDVSESLRAKLSNADKQKFAKNYTENSEAYQLYLMGRYLQDKGWFGNQEEARRSITYFEQAIAKDPEYALAYAGIADSYSSLGNFNIISSHEAAAKTRAAALKSLELDDTLAESHTALAYVLMNYDWNWEASDREYQKAIELNPRYTRAHSLYAWSLAARGRFDEALAHMGEALKYDPLSSRDNRALVWYFYVSRRYDEAFKQLSKVIEMESDRDRFNIELGNHYVQKGMYQEGIAKIEKHIAVYGSTSYALKSLGYAYAVAGRKTEAQKILNELQKLSKQEYVSPFIFAQIYAGLNEKDQAFAYLEKAYEQRDGLLAGHLKVEPRLDNLRSDPRYADLLRRIGLPQ